MDKAKILRLCNDIEMIMCEVSNTGHTMQDCDYEAVDKRLKAIVAEITAPPKTNGDKIRQMSDEELAEIVRFVLDCEDCTFHGNNGCSGDCYTGAISWLRKEVHEDD